jgi:hypothetical protein
MKKPLRNDSLEQASDKQLAELLTTREVDASQLLRKNRVRKEDADKSHMIGDQLSEDQSPYLRTKRFDESKEVSADRAPRRFTSAVKLAALMKKDVEAVVTRQVEKRLPAIVKRLVAKEIEQIEALWGTQKDDQKQEKEDTLLH